MTGMPITITVEHDWLVIET
ncbi:hypothetical protein ACLECX_15725 [Lonsdalea quercina]